MAPVRLPQNTETPLLLNHKNSKIFSSSSYSYIPRKNGEVLLFAGRWAFYLPPISIRSTHTSSGFRGYSRINHLICIFVFGEENQRNLVVVGVGVIVSFLTTFPWDHHHTLPVFIITLLNTTFLNSSIFHDPKILCFPSSLLSIFWCIFFLLFFRQ